MIQHDTRETVSLYAISENLSSELQIILDDVLELQRALLNEKISQCPENKNIEIAQKFDFVEQGLCDIRRLLGNFCNSYNSATLQPLKHSESAVSHRSSSSKLSPEYQNTRSMAPSNGTPSQPHFDTSVLVTNLKLGRIRDRFICCSTPSGNERTTGEVDWL